MAWYALLPPRYIDRHVKTIIQTQGFWRLYELDCPGVLNCRILERFRSDTFHLTDAKDDGKKEKSM